MAKSCRVKVAWCQDKSRDDWNKNRTYKRCRHLAINARWAARRIADDYWILTHRPTGFAAAHCESFKHAQRIARVFDAKYGRKAWDFTEPDHAIGRFPGAGELARQLGALF